MVEDQKFNDTVLTNIGHKMLTSLASGNKKITYTKAEAYSQDVSSIDNGTLQALTSLQGMELSTNLLVSNENGNVVTITANFENKGLTSDAVFNSVGWFAELDTSDTENGITANQEYLIGITPANGAQTLVAPPADQSSSQAISLNLNMTLSDAASVNMTVSDAGAVHFNQLDDQLANYTTTSDLTKLLDGKLSTVGTVKTVDKIQPDSNGNVDLQPEFNSLLGRNNLLTDDEMDISKAAKNDQAQNAISNAKYANGISTFHYCGAAGWEIFNWEIAVQPNTNYELNIIANSTSQLTALDPTNEPYIPITVDSSGAFGVTGTVSNGDLGKGQLNLPWQGIETEKITFNSKNYSNIYLAFTLGTTVDGVNTDITLQTTLLKADPIQSQIDNLQNQTSTKANSSDVSALQNTVNSIINQVKQIDGETVISDATDVNTLLGTANQVTVYKLTNTGNTNAPSWLRDNRGVMIVLNYDGNAKTQIWTPFGVDAFNTDGTLGWRYWEGNNPSAWNRFASKSYVDNLHTDLQNQITTNDNATITTGYDWNTATPTNQSRTLQNAWIVDQVALKGAVDRMNNTDTNVSAISNKVNVDGNLFSAPGKITSWADVQADGSKSVLRSIRTEGQATDFNTGGYDAGIVFGGNDTKALISVGFAGSQARVTGGNNNAVWHEDIAWKSDITNLQNQINQQNQAIQSLTTRLTNAENEISYIKANYIEGKQFPASQEAQATAWENANPQGIAFITSN